MDQELINLRDVLAALYMTQREALSVVEAARIPMSRIDWDGSSRDRWHGIVREADRHKKTEALVKVALKDYPENEWLQAAARGDLRVARGPDIETEVNWQDPQDSGGLEKIMGSVSTLLPISFLEVGLERSKAVAKVELPDASGSGFLTAGNLLITNHHVIPSREIARVACIRANYRQTWQGLDIESQEYHLNPDGAQNFATSEQDDWTAVRLREQPGGEFISVPLRRVDLHVRDLVNIVQHPAGGPKQIALYHNIVTYVGRNRVQYLTDTLPGSSGSPVFDMGWNVVALHHSGGWLREPESKRAVYRNEGIDIKAVIDGLEQAGMAAVTP